MCMKLTVGAMPGLGDNGAAGAVQPPGGGQEIRSLLQAFDVRLCLRNQWVFGLSHGPARSGLFSGL